MKKAIFLVSIFIFLASVSSSAQQNELTAKEKTYVSLFNSFKNYVSKCVKDKQDITDSAHLEFILNKFLFTNSELSTDKSSTDKLLKEQSRVLKKTINSFYQFLLEAQSPGLADNLVALPLRLSEDSFIYKRLSAFQKENTLIFFDKRYPKQTLGYILFIPEIKDVNLSPKIWSWTLEYKFGKFLFISALGEEGYEYIFEEKR